MVPVFFQSPGQPLPAGGIPRGMMDGSRRCRKKTPMNDGLRFGDFPDTLRLNSIPMKATALLSLLFLLTPLAAQTKSPPAAKTPPADGKPAAAKTDKAAKVELLPNQKAFLNMPEEKRKEFIKHLMEANRIFQQKRVFETMEEIDKASAIFKDSPELYNLRGSCYVEMRSFDKAMAEFEKAFALANKDNPNIEFNIGEVFFVTKQWQKAADVFERICKRITTENPALGRLTEFKILLCKKKLGKKEEVAALTEKYDFMDDSPFYYYAKATQSYDDNDQKKAEEWLATAGRVFQDPNTTAPWKDTLVEYGYIKGLYGSDAQEEEK
jgi:tetratricopeptide (TPR) repeat protein